MTGVHQVGCNLTKDEAAALSRYAREWELSRPKLCALLVLRELAAARLDDLRTFQPGSEPKDGSSRVTARVSAGTKRRFEDHVGANGIGSNDAAAMLFRAELQERWLEAVLSAPHQNRP